MIQIPAPGVSRSEDFLRLFAEGPAEQFIAEEIRETDLQGSAEIFHSAEENAAGALQIGNRDSGVTAQLLQCDVFFGAKYFEPFFDSVIQCHENHLNVIITDKEMISSHFEKFLQ